MTLTASSVRAVTVEAGKIRAGYNDFWFKEFIDSDSFDSSDNGTSDRTNPEDLNLLFDLHPNYSHHHYTATPKSAVLDKCLPSPVIDQTLAIPHHADRGVTLLELNSIKCPPYPHASLVRNNKKVNSIAPSPTYISGVTRPDCVQKTKSRSYSTSKMPNRGSRRPSGDRRDSKPESTPANSSASSKGRRRTSHTPASAPLPQTQWPTSTGYPEYHELYSASSYATDASTFRSPSQHQDPLQSSQPTTSSLPAPASSSYEDSQREDFTNYFQSSTTSYDVEDESSMAGEFSDYATHQLETSFPYGSPHDPTGISMTYARDHDYDEPRVPPWWVAPSGPEPYSATLPTTEYQRRLHVSPSPSSQSDFIIDTRTLSHNREAQVSDTNFRDYELEQAQSDQIYLESQGNSIDATREQLRHQLPIRSSPPRADSVRKSKSPSVRPQAIRTPSLASAYGKLGGSGSATSSTSRKLTRTTSAPGREERPKIEFHNFTTEDSAKLLSGVAPSGSSKTKARREKEALERRKRLSRAAAKAVLDAGGDLEPLLREGFVIESDEEGEFDA